MPYPSQPFKVTHPDHLYTLGRLFKLDAPLPDQASILELGCASGGNLIPLAVQMPGARVVGVDLSARQIAEGQAIVDQLGLRNIQLLAKDLNDVDESFGNFDYIVCHGVFSWVPEPVQQRILQICRERLTPNGIAYISYNAYPGWFMRGMIRQMMLYHVAAVPEPVSKVRQARALLSFIVNALEGQKTPHAAIVKQELDLLTRAPDAYLFHEHLEEHNRPMFFYQFMQMARAHGLQLLSEASLPSMLPMNLPEKAAEALTQLTQDILQQGQYMDFVTNRMFRQTLLCRSGVPLDRQLNPDRIADGHFSSPIQPAEGQKRDLNPTVEATFRSPSGRQIKGANPVLKAMAYTLIDAYPGSLSVDEMARRVIEQLGQVSRIQFGETEQRAIVSQLRANLLQMVVRGDADLRSLPDRFMHRLSERPAVSALTLLQCRQSSQTLTTQTHGQFAPDPLSRLLIQSVDGTRTRADLMQHLAGLVEQGKVNITAQPGQTLDVEASHAAAIDKLLETLRRQALLVG